MVGVELRGIYQGVCYWWCPICDRRVHRFPETDPIHARVQMFIHGFSARIEDRP
jgi:hypothetical protein